MSWLSTSTRRIAPVSGILVAFVLAATAGFAAAQNLETAIMPGPVIQGHAKLESKCGNCHVRMDRAAQPRLCMDCHKEVAADVRGRTGHHGRIKQQECRACHTEHKGRDANVVVLDRSRFDHTLTDFALRGKHASVTCASCHRAKVKYSDAPGDCLSCHRKDDKHKGGLGVKCADCHDERTWKETRFDHAKTRFKLLFSHEKVKCADCHPNQRYEHTPTDCLACHRKDDTHKGLFGPRCHTCHDEAKWKTPTFNHDSDTHYVLRYRHRSAKCESCHRKPVTQEKLPTNCVSCHRKDDTHKSALGDKCESCHSERTWKSASVFDHNRDSRFALRGKHRDVKCESCHKDMGFRTQPSIACIGCHERDEREKGHRGQLGKQCETCHNEKSWRETGFDHKKSEFPLLGRHAKVECKECHTTKQFKEAKTDCLSCHLKDDTHKERLGPRCAECHDARSWKTPNFDHNQKSRFKLVDAHVKVACKECHTAPVKDKLVLAIDCASCHAKKDPHKERLGPRCEDCHDARSWKTPTFRPQPEEPLQASRRAHQDQLLRMSYRAGERQARSGNRLRELSCQER